MKILDFHFFVHSVCRCIFTRNMGYVVKTYIYLEVVVFFDLQSPPPPYAYFAISTIHIYCIRDLRSTIKWRHHRPASSLGCSPFSTGLVIPIRDTMLLIFHPSILPTPRPPSMFLFASIRHWRTRSTKRDRWHSSLPRPPSLLARIFYWIPSTVHPLTPRWKPSLPTFLKLHSSLAPSVLSMTACLLADPSLSLFQSTSAMSGVLSMFGLCLKHLFTLLC